MSRANFVQVQLAAAATSSQTLLSVKAPVGGFVLPPADGGRLVLTDSPGRPTAYEIITYTSRTGSGPYTLNGVTRGVEGTSGLPWAVDTFVMQSLTVGELDELLAGKVDKTTQVIAGTGLEGGGSLSANRTLSVKYGTTAGTAAEGNDSRLSDSREWTASTVTQAEAEAGTATTRRAWTAQRVRQAIAAWFNGVSGALGRTILTRTTAAQVRSDIGLGTAATQDVGESSGQVMQVGAFGIGTAPISFTGSSFEAQLTRNMMTVQRPTGDVPSDSPESGAVKALAIGDIGAWESHLAFAAYSHNLYLRSRSSSGGPFLPWVRMYHTGNLLDIGTTPATARSALGLTDAATTTVASIRAGNAASATKLATARTINGTSFDGSANITTANWGTARTLTVGNTSKSVNGSANVSWTLAEIGAAAASHTHSYLPLSGGTLTGALTIRNGAAEMQIHLGSSGYYLYGNATAVGIYHPSGWPTFRINQSEVNVTGNFTASGNVTAYSDIRLKTDIQTIPDALDKVCQLGGYTYLRTDTGERQTGVIAQEVQKVLPEAVTGDETLGVAYGNLAGLFIEAIKELTRKIEDQQARIDELERRTTA